MLTNNLPHSLPMHAVNPSEITKFLASRATIDVHPEHHPARNHSRPRICRSTDCIHHRPSPLAAQSNLASRVYEPKCPIKSSPPPHRFLSKCIKKREANASHQGVAPPHIPAANLPRTAMLRVQSIPLTCFSSSIPLAFTHPPALRASNPGWEMLLGYHA